MFSFAKYLYICLQPNICLQFIRTHQSVTTEKLAAFVLVPTSGYFKCGNDLSKAVQRWKTGTVQTSLWTARCIKIQGTNLTY